MSELSLTIIRVAFLAALWLFVIAAIGVVRTDLLGGLGSATRRGAEPARPRTCGRSRPARPGRSARAGVRPAPWS